MNLIFAKYFLYNDFVNINAPNNGTLLSFLLFKIPKLSLYYKIFSVYSRRRRKQELNQGTYTYILHSMYCIFQQLNQEQIYAKMKYVYFTFDSVWNWILIRQIRCIKLHTKIAYKSFYYS